MIVNIYAINGWIGDSMQNNSLICMFQKDTDFFVTTVWLKKGQNVATVAM